MATPLGVSVWAPVGDATKMQANTETAETVRLEKGNGYGVVIHLWGKKS